MSRTPLVLAALVLSVSGLDAQGRQRPRQLADDSSSAPTPSATSAVEVFELDGNAVKNGAADDWAFIQGGGGNHIAFSGITPDPGQNTIFTGGKKDIQDLDQWGWKNNGGFPDKNDITNAYAAAYMENGDLVVYFGADRYANTGDAFLGFWFFKERIQLLPNGQFDGLHTIGDILILVNYPQGATSMPAVHVLEWNPPLEDVASNLRLLFSGPGAMCGAVPPAEACAITNLTDMPSPWPYTPKSGTPGVFPPESFFEGGVNLSAILGTTACFSSFIAETRSSTSISATLKDFVLGEFPVCGITVQKTCQVTSFTNDFTGFVVDFTATVANNGAGTFPIGSLVTVTDDAGTPNNDQDDVVLMEVLEQPLAAGGSLQVSGQFVSAQNPPYNRVSATIETTDLVVNASEFGIECSPLALNPDLALSKSCSLALETVNGYLVVRVDFTGEVENTGDVPLAVTVIDDMAGEVLAETLMNPGDTIPLSGSYYPSAANGGVTDPSAAMFSDTFTAFGTNPMLPSTVVEMITANCGLCPN